MEVSGPGEEPTSGSLERLGQRLFAETGGQPFYLIETLKLLLEHSLFTPYPGGDGASTGDIAAAIVKELGVARRAIASKFGN